LRRIDDERRSDLAQPSTDGNEIDAYAVDPMTMRQRGERRAFVDGAEERRGPVAGRWIVTSSAPFSAASARQG
jgi:hypothetical protein